MGKETVHFKCHSCSHCCTEVVCLPTPEDVRRIVKHTGKKPNEFLEFLTPEELEGVEKNDPTWLRTNGKKFMMALRRVKSGKGMRCFFLDKKTRLCTIYEARPILCRLYPFKLHETRKGKFKGFSLHTDVGCPRNRDGVVQTKPLYDLYLEDCVHQEEYDDLVESFNDQDGAAKPEDFLKRFSAAKKGAA